MPGGDCGMGLTAGAGGCMDTGGMDCGADIGPGMTPGVGALMGTTPGICTLSAAWGGSCGPISVRTGPGIPPGMVGIPRCIGVAPGGNGPKPIVPSAVLYHP